MTLLLLGAPVVPGRELARELARRELSDPVYAKARPGLLQRLVQWLVEQVQHLAVPTSALTGPRTGVVLLVLLAVVVTVVVLRRTGRLRGPAGRAAQAALFSGRPLTAGEHRRLADEAAATGHWDDAVRERFRAVVRGLEERVVLDERPGRTADEAASEAALSLPALADALHEGARLFDDVSYGERPARAEHDTRLRRLDDAVRAARLQGVG
jgi:hypothetical protein